MTLAPLATALVVIFAPRVTQAGFARVYALAGSIVTLVLSLGFISGMRADPAAYSSFMSVPWIDDWGIRFTLGLDGLSGMLVLLTNLLIVVSILASWTAITDRTREFYACLLVLQTGIIGTFLALDLFVFYIFWELMLIPLYLLIGIFGSSNRIYATMKFFLYTMAGSLLMLIGILTLYFKTAPLLDDGATFSIMRLIQVSSQLPIETQTVIFFAFAIAFSIKIPLFPFHTWLPDAHTEAPTAGSIMLAGVLLKTGVYGLIRFAIPLFPAVAVAYAPLFLTLAVIAIIYGALTALVQEDMKRLVAYSSVSHMGFIVLGLFSFREEAISGAALQMLSHGISTGGLFYCVGLLYERRHTRLLSEFGGLAYNMKIYAVLTVIIVLSSVGLPGLNGFVGEFLILLGTFQVAPVAAALATLGVILAAVYLLRMTQLVLFGKLDREENKALSDLNPREISGLVVLIFFVFWIGLYPRPFLKLVEPTARALAELVKPDAAGESASDRIASTPTNSPSENSEPGRMDGAPGR